MAISWSCGDGGPIDQHRPVPLKRAGVGEADGEDGCSPAVGAYCCLKCLVGGAVEADLAQGPRRGSNCQDLWIE